MSEHSEPEKRAQAAAPRGEPADRHHVPSDGLLDGVYEFDIEGRFTYCNASAKILFGYRPDDDLSALNVKDTIVSDDYTVSSRDIERIIAGETVRAERTFLRRNGERFIGEVHSGPVYRDGRVVGVRGVVRDVTAQRTAEKRLRESELRLRTLFDLSPQPIAVTELETGRLIDVNLRFCELSGYAKDEILGRTTMEIGVLSPDLREQFATELRRAGEVRAMPIQFSDRHGKCYESLVFARQITVAERQVILTVVLDLTEQRELEARLARAQKLEAIGTLAGGVAHDFNNILTVVGGLVSLGRSRLDASHPVSDLLNGIEDQVQSAAALTRQLLAYARTGKRKVLPTDLRDLVQTTAEMFARAHKEISLAVECEERECWATVDRSQIEHALLNLFVNAAHAMPAGGRIRVVMRLDTLNDTAARARELASGRYVAITVEDSGTGMDAQTRARIFDPFFTTKEMGRGTGLGLASVYGAVKGHDGAIDVWSEPGEGTRFEIHLPATGASARPDRSESRAPRSGRGVVLLVDDEKVVADVTAAMLRDLGYEVLLAYDGAEAVDLFARRSRDVDLVLLDVIMPGMGGVAVFDELRRIQPDVAVVLFSGYSVDSEAGRALRQECRGVLQKPFTMHELADGVARALSGTGAEVGPSRPA